MRSWAERRKLSRWTSRRRVEWLKRLELLAKLDR